MPRFFSFTGVGVVFLGLFGFVVAGAAQGQKVGAPPEASNMRLAGYDNLQHRSAYQPTIFHQGNRWIAYIGHHGGTHDVPKPVNPLTGQAEYSGTSIVDGPIRRIQNICIIFPAKRASTSRAARRWHASVP